MSEPHKFRDRFFGTDTATGRSVSIYSEGEATAEGVKIHKQTIIEQTPPGEEPTFKTEDRHA